MGLDFLPKSIPVKKAFPLHMWDRFDWFVRYGEELPETLEEIFRQVHELLKEDNPAEAPQSPPEAPDGPSTHPDTAASS